MHLEVDRTDLHRTRLVDVPHVPLRDGDVRLRIDGFALTANNITYGAFGDAMQYWSFFPAEEGWGRIPVWGFADVVESTADEVPEGTRVYGYLPMADELVVVPGRVDPGGFTDAAPHRQAMAAVYNRYVRVDADPVHDPAREGQQMVLWPLFFTGFLIDDLLADQGLADGTAVVSSASSKTASATAFLLHARPGTRVVGLTSTAHRTFAEDLGCYHQVVTYDDVEALPAGPAAYVDISGNADVRAAVHRHFGDALAQSMMVGATHWDHRPSTDAPLAGPEPQFFFAPAQVAKRTEDWGRDELDRRITEAWHRYVAWTDDWLDLRRTNGPDDVEALYHEVLEGGSEPQVGHVCSMIQQT